MRISKKFVVGYLIVFLIVLAMNLIAPIFGIWNSYYLVALMLCFLVLFFLIYRKQDNGTVKFFKFMVLLIPLVVIGFVLYSNFIASQDFEYFYDIGSAQDAKKPYLTPLVRMSDIDNATSSRNISSGLVYFDVPIPRGSDNLSVSLRIFDNFPEKSNLKVGGKNQANWSYNYSLAYDSKINNGTNGQWIVVNASLDLKDLYIVNGKLNMLINAHHLDKNATQNYTIPIDWIKVDIHKNGIFEKSD